MTELPLWSVYDEMGERFERHASDSAYNAHYDRPAVRAALGEVRGARVLDAGCGPGLLMQQLISDGAACSGFDASPAMLGLARRRLGEGADLREALLGQPLPYPDESFDAAVCALAIHYLPDPRAGLVELRRVVRPGGRVVVSTQHPFTDWLRKGGSYFERVLEADTWRLDDGTTQQVRFWRITLSELCNAAIESGLRIERVIEPLPAPSMQVRDPEEYQELHRRPGFLVLSLLRP